MTQPRMSLSAVVLDAPDARELADFYRRLRETRVDEGDWVMLERADGGTSLSFQTEEFYVRPVWPGIQGGQLMMLHLDIEVDDLDEAGLHAVAQGAVLAEFQPQEDVRVYLDPVGHPFCLWIQT